MCLVVNSIVLCHRSVEIMRPKQKSNPVSTAQKNMVNGPVYRSNPTLAILELSFCFFNGWKKVIKQYSPHNGVVLIFYDKTFGQKIIT